MGDKGLPESRNFAKRKVLRAGRQGAKLDQSTNTRSKVRVINAI